VTPYYADESVRLFLGDCRVVAEWLLADVLVTDPPYGRGWRKHGGGVASNGSRQTMPVHQGITGDGNTVVRQAALAAWGPSRPAAVFGDLLLCPPPGTKQVLIYALPPGSGLLGARFGWRRDTQAVYVMGQWPPTPSGATSVLRTSCPNGPGRLALVHGHPHAKPVDVMETLIAACPPGVIADPFAGSGSTLVAARNQGRHAIGVEIEEKYCEIAARRLSQQVLTMEER
jgi:site-specific DNA-methyltransferase (adenine-specific)